MTVKIWTVRTLQIIKSEGRIIGNMIQIIVTLWPMIRSTFEVEKPFETLVLIFEFFELAKKP